MSKIRNFFRDLFISNTIIQTQTITDSNRNIVIQTSNITGGDIVGGNMIIKEKEYIWEIEKYVDVKWVTIGELYGPHDEIYHTYDDATEHMRNMQRIAYTEPILRVVRAE